MQNRAILTSMRAAAMVVVATGLNEVISGAEPRYEPLYVYLGAVAIIVWLDGMLLGGLTAVGCTILYTLLFGSIPPLVPLFAMLVVVVVTGIIRALVRSRMRHAPPQLIYPNTMPLLPPIVENTEVLAAIDELRAEMRAAVSAPPPNLAEAQRLSEALADAQSALQEERRRAQAVTAEATLLRLEADHAAQEGTRAAKRIEELEAALANAGDEEELERVREERDTLAGRVTELELSAHEAERVRLDLAALRERHDSEMRAERARTIAARAESSARSARVAELEAQLAEARVERDRAEAEARSESVRAEAARGETEALQATLERERSEFDSKLNTIVSHLASDHESDLGQAVAEREEARAEARMLTARVASLQSKLLELETPAPPQAPASALVGRGRARILVAHPDADLRANAQASLTRAGYDVLTAADGLEALRLANAQTPEVVIADAVMPKMNGRELCQLLKSQEKTSHIRVVLLLRTTDPAPKGELVPDEVLRKPVPLETLRSTLAALLAPQ